MKTNIFKHIIMWAFMIFVSIIIASYSDGNYVVIFTCAIFAALAGIYLGISIDDKSNNQKSSAQIISDQAAEIAELRRGIGDIFLALFLDKRHDSIKNNDEMISAIIRKLYKDQEEQK